MDSSSNESDDELDSAALQAEMRELREALHGDAVLSDKPAAGLHAAVPSHLPTDPPRSLHHQERRGADVTMDGSESGSDWSGSSAEEDSSDGETADPDASSEDDTRQPRRTAVPTQTAAKAKPALSVRFAPAPEIEEEEDPDGMMNDSLLDDGFGRREMEMMQDRARGSIRMPSKPRANQPKGVASGSGAHQQQQHQQHQHQQQQHQQQQEQDQHGQREQISSDEEEGDETAMEEAGFGVAAPSADLELQPGEVVQQVTAVHVPAAGPRTGSACVITKRTNPAASTRLGARLEALYAALSLNRQLQGQMLVALSRLERVSDQRELHSSRVEGVRRPKGSAAPVRPAAVTTQPAGSCVRSLQLSTTPSSGPSGCLPRPVDVMVVAEISERLQQLPSSLERLRWTKRMIGQLHTGIQVEIQSRLTVLLLNKQTQAAQQDGGSEGLQLDELEKEFERIKGVVLDSAEGRTLVTLFDAAAWERVSSAHVHERTPGDCRKYYKHVMLPQPEWTREEDGRLEELAGHYQEREWATIALELGTGRSPAQVLRHYLRSLKPALLAAAGMRPPLNGSGPSTAAAQPAAGGAAATAAVAATGGSGSRSQKLAPRSGGRLLWEEGDDVLLRQMVERHGTQWKIISQAMGGRFDRHQLRDRWHGQAKAGSRKTGRWTPEETKKLEEAIAKAIAKVGTLWQQVGPLVGTRSAAQCRERYDNCLSPGIKAGRFSEAEAALLVSEVTRQVTAHPGGKIMWAAVAAKLPGRTDARCKDAWKQYRKDGVIKVGSGSGSQTRVRKREPTEAQAKAPKRSKHTVPEAVMPEGDDGIGGMAGGAMAGSMDVCQQQHPSTQSDTLLPADTAMQDASKGVTAVPPGVPVSGNGKGKQGRKAATQSDPAAQTTDDAMGGAGGAEKTSSPAQRKAKRVGVAVRKPKSGAMSAVLQSVSAASDGDSMLEDGCPAPTGNKKGGGKGRAQRRGGAGKGAEGSKDGAACGSGLSQAGKVQQQADASAGQAGDKADAGVIDSAVGGDEAECGEADDEWEDDGK
ncbi:MAG: hypothetical protein WDW38_003107 [Sanguina aurantia]